MRQANTPACLIFFMQRLMRRFLVVALACGILTVSAAAQSGTKTAATDASSSSQKGLSLAEQGHCREALPILKKSAPLTSDKQLKIKAGLATVRCGLSSNQIDAAVNALLWLNREFPSDPDVLYVTTHAFSDLSTRAAMQLANTAPLSTQAHELNAESLESQAKWDEAAAEYTQILKQQPDLPGIHYRLGRIILSRTATPTTVNDARNEFQAELKIDPNNAGAEYVLGELSRQAQQWEDAIEHFSRASKLDANFADAFLGLGFSLNSAGRYAEAIPSLETGVRLQPANPTGHYELAIAYNRVGRKEDAKREAMLQKETAERIEQDKQRAAGAPQ
jgi:tetratricopeptide (TPR) repeat protein